MGGVPGGAWAFWGRMGGSVSVLGRRLVLGEDGLKAAGHVAEALLLQGGDGAEAIGQVHRHAKEGRLTGGDGGGDLLREGEAEERGEAAGGARRSDDSSWN